MYILYVLTIGLVVVSAIVESVQCVKYKYKCHSSINDNKDQYIELLVDIGFNIVLICALMYPMYESIVFTQPFVQIGYIVLFVLGLIFYNKIWEFYLNTMISTSIFVYCVIGSATGSSLVFIVLMFILISQYACLLVARKISYDHGTAYKRYIKRHSITSIAFLMSLLVIDVFCDASIYNFCFIRKIDSVSATDYLLSFNLVSFVAIILYIYLFYEFVRVNQNNRKSRLDTIDSGSNHSVI